MTLDGIAKKRCVSPEEVCAFIWRKRWSVQQFFSVPADDVLQETCCGYIEAAAKGKIDRPLSYACGILRNKIVEFIGDLQASRRCVDISVLYETPWPFPDPEQQAIRKEARLNALAVVQSLKPKQAEVIRRGYIEGEPTATTCREMGLSKTQYRLLKHRGKALAAECYRHRYKLS